MDKFSFIKYVNLKEKKLEKYKIILENKIQTGGTNLDLKNIQIELLKIKKKINNIKEFKNDSVIDPYNKLKDLI